VTTVNRPPSRSQPVNQFVLNISPIEFEDTDVEVGVFAYKGREQLAELRSRYGTTHVFRREKGTEVLAVPFVLDAPTLGDTARTVRLWDQLGLVAALYRNALINHLHRLPRKVLDYMPVTFLADELKEDFLRRTIQSGTKCPDWLSVCPLYEADVRAFRFDRRRPILGVCVNVFTRRLISLTCQGLIHEGFSLPGHYVGHRTDTNDERIQPRFRLLGKVEVVEGDWLRLSDCRIGEELIASCDAFIETAAFDPILRHVFGSGAGTVIDRLDRIRSDFRSGPARLVLLRTVSSYFANHPLEVVPGVTCRCTRFLSQDDPAEFPTIDKTPPVVYVFDPIGTKTSASHTKGMNDYGPYSAPSFTPTRPRICVICQRGHKGRVEQFVSKFLNGILLPGGKRSSFAKGFIRKYALEDASVDFFETNGPTASAYQKAIWQALTAQTKRGTRYDLALVEIEERFHDLSGASDPYLISKAEFMSQQIPVQEFEIETTEIPDSRLQYVLNNMGLASYAKLNGTPWLIRASRPIAHELVIGLGSAKIGDGRLGDSERVVGITTVFSGDGNYCVYALSRAVGFENYEEEVLNTLKATIERLSHSMNWQPKEHVRLVFHSFKPLKQAEEDAVKALMGSLGDYDVEYAFVHVVEDHPFLLFDEAQKGVPSYDGSGIKGACAPLRGRLVRLSGHEVLLTLIGAKEVKRPSDGMPRPVLLRLGRGSTFNDMTYLARQVDTFACHSWRSFDPSPFPVTIMYSQLIARLLGRLSLVPHWNPAQMLGRIGETLWFL
jgi:hypothetical protein